MAVLTRLEICLIFIYSEDKNVNWTSVTLKPSLHFYIFKIYFFHCIWPCKLMYSLQICPGLSRVCDMTACRLCKKSWKHTRVDFLNSMCVYVQIAVRVVCLYVCLDDFFSCLFQQKRAALPRQAPDLVSLWENRCLVIFSLVDSLVFFDLIWMCAGHWAFHIFAKDSLCHLLISPTFLIKPLMYIIVLLLMKVVLLWLISLWWSGQVKF